MFDRDKFFDSLRGSGLFPKFTQQQVDGINFKLDQWEEHHPEDDLRWMAYAFATSYHETSQKMWPIEEYGKGSGMSYGKPDPVTGQTYYGRGDVQLTWKDNYARATKELGLSGANDLVQHPEKALDAKISADVMYTGMIEGWFRKGNTLAKFFDDKNDDAFGAREIINGDKNTVPSWSNGVSIGNLIAGYHKKFLAAAQASWTDGAAPQPKPETPAVGVDITVPDGIDVTVTINGKQI